LVWGIWQDRVVPEDPVRPPRTPLRVAVMTFGAVVLIVFVIGIVAMSINGNLHDNPYARGEKVGQAVTPLAVVCAVAAYFIQKRKLENK